MGIGQEVNRAKSRRKGTEVSSSGGGGGTEDMSQESPAKGGIVGEALNGPCCLS